MTIKKTFTQLQEELVQCRICPRLVEHREKTAREKRRAYRDWSYWGKPVPSLGTRSARLLILGLAPAGHGANRTGRMFTGDRSGDFLYDTLHRFDFCSQPTSRDLEDGLRLRDAYITAALHCAPPLNKPTRQELMDCRHYLRWELKLLSRVRVVVALGRIAWQVYWWARMSPGLFPSSPTPPAINWMKKPPSLLPTIPASKTPRRDDSPRRCLTGCSRWRGRT